MGALDLLDHVTAAIRYDAPNETPLCGDVMEWDGKMRRPVKKVLSRMESGPAVDLPPSRIPPVGSGFDGELGEIRLAVVDRFLVVRQGVRRMLAAVPDIVVVAEADAAEGMMDVLLRRSVNVLLIDTDLGLPCAQNMLKTISYRIPDLGIVLFASACRDSDIDMALHIGVAGFIMKSTRAAGLVTSIRRAADQLSSFCGEVTARMVSWNTRRNPTIPVSRLATLTDRETEVLRLLSKGFSTKKIAWALGISSKTVDNHRSRIMSKLNIHNRVELCRFAVREGIITP